MSSTPSSSSQEKYGPDPSPPSSPCAGPIDSSAPTSPELGATISLDSPPNSPMHMYTGLAKSTRRPPLRSKKPRHPDAGPIPPSQVWPGYMPGPVYLSEPQTGVKRQWKGEVRPPECSQQSPTPGPSSPGPSSPVPPALERAARRARLQSLSSDPKQIWNQQLEDAIMNAQEVTNIDLSGRRLPFIDTDIADLSFIVILPDPDKDSLIPVPLPIKGALAEYTRQLERSATTPAQDFPPSIKPRLKRVGSSAAVLPPPRPKAGGNPAEEIHIFLADNEITFIPLELTSLARLTVLSLRQNRISYVPPEIAHLPCLRELNLSANRLKYLPSEMLGMRLEKLWLASNPFLEPPDLPFVDKNKNNITKRRAMGPITTSFPTLRELCLRKLFSRCSSSPEKTNLREFYALPFSNGSLQPHLLTIFAACAGACGKSSSPRQLIPSHIHLPTKTIGSSESLTYPEYVARNGHPITGLGICPSPHHHLGNIDPTTAASRAPVFVHPAEECFTWEKIVAGLSQPSVVPIKWRGCGIGCLQFLDEDLPPRPVDSGNDASFASREYDFSDSDSDLLS